MASEPAAQLSAVEYRHVVELEQDDADDGENRHLRAVIQTRHLGEPVDHDGDEPAEEAHVVERVGPIQ